MRYVLTIATLFIVAILPLQAQTGIPENSFWYEPKNFSAGSTVTFTTLVYNSENAEAVFTIALLDNKTKLQEKQLVIPARDARAVAFEWAAAGGSHVFEAVIQSVRSGGKAVQVDQKIGRQTLRIGEESETEGRISELEDTVKEKSRSILSRIDSWRIRKLAQYEQRKMELKARIDRVESAEQLEMLTQPDRFNEANIESRPFLPTPNTVLVYLEYFLYMVLTFIFSAPLFFYIASGFLLFLALRFFYVRMV